MTNFSSTGRSNNAAIAFLIFMQHSFGARIFDFDYTNRRTNFCAIHEKMANGDVSVKNALEGMNVSAAVVEQLDERSISTRMLDEIAAKAKFNVDYIYTGHPEDNETYTDILLRSIDHTDLACNWWERRMFRLDLNIAFMEDFYQADTIMVRKPASAPTKFNHFAAAKPFSMELWILIIFVVFLTGLVYYILDFIASKTMRRELDTHFSRSIFLSFHAFTGHCNYEAKSKPSQILTTSMCFLYLILISAYTANLANFFALSNSPSLDINTIDDVMELNLQICLVKGFPISEVIQKTYMSANIVWQEDERDLLISLSDGNCDIGLIALETWKYLRKDSRYNKFCDLEPIGRRVDNVRAGFAYKDSFSLCSSVLHSVISYHLVSMKVDGTFEEIWEDYRESTASVSCDTKSKNIPIKYKRVQLGLINMSGAFVFHLILSLCSIFIAVHEYYFHPSEVKKKIKSDVLVMVEEAVTSMRQSVSWDDNNLLQVSIKGDSFRSQTLAECMGKLDDEERNKLSMEHLILLMYKVEFMKNLYKKDRALLARKLDQIYSKAEKYCIEQQSTMEELRKQLNNIK